MHFSITLIIIIITCVVSFGGFSNQKLLNDLIFYPPAITEQKQWYRFFTCGLIHADAGHLIFNMLALYLFGDVVEKYFTALFGEKGKLLYLLLYVFALMFCLLPTLAKHRNDYYYRSLGASGAVSAVIFASILFNPLVGIGLFFIPIYIAGFIFGIIYLLISSWLDKKGGSTINHSAHIYGALFGIVFTIVACSVFSDYPVLKNFIDQIVHADLKQFIQFGA
ncbi:MAG TPA: rhomboid family intramembrane serine protease [Chitinophagaceae bacterium]|nr:rhomboid family intramembrane serine protease [Chitinophagaceae bacterium]